jgi:hypothetical protein
MRLFAHVNENTELCAWDVVSNPPSPPFSSKKLIASSRTAGQTDASTRTFYSRYASNVFNQWRVREMRKTLWAFLALVLLLTGSQADLLCAATCSNHPTYNADSLQQKRKTHHARVAEDQPSTMGECHPTADTGYSRVKVSAVQRTNSCATPLCMKSAPKPALSKAKLSNATQNALEASANRKGPVNPLRSLRTPYLRCSSLPGLSSLPLRI